MAGRALAATLAALVLAWAHAISYTVQVVAVSDQETALSLQRQLLLDSFPAYVVRTTTAQGDIYRVRVGAFANRAAALVFAESMPPVAGSPALPALAEGIPAGVMPLEPRLLLEVEGHPMELLDWNGAIAARLQSDPHAPATYRILGEEEVSFSAWRAAPLESGEVLRLRNMSLWPATWESDPPEVRASHRASLIRFLAEQFEVEPSAVVAAELREEGEPPYLIVVERFRPTATGEGIILGILVPDAEVPSQGADGLLGPGPLPPVEEPLYHADASSEPIGGSFEGEAWHVSYEEPYVLLRSEGADRGWRAALGHPLWSNAALLLTRHEGRLFVYDFVPR